MKTLKNAFFSFLGGVGIGALIEAFISMGLGINIVGVPEFVETIAPGYAKIIQCLCYGGFGLVPFLVGECLKNRKGSFYLEQGLYFFTLLLYFLFVGFYLKWFVDPGSVLGSVLLFVAIYFVIWIAIYLKEKRLIEKMNEQLK